MGRKTKRNAEVEAVIAKHLSDGSTIKDACGSVGIPQDTFCDWSNRFPEFSELVTRAQAEARQRAVKVIKSALDVTQQITEATEMIEETRLRTVRHDNGTVEQVPYTHKRLIAKKSVTLIPADWRAAVEYLKRRDKEHWSDKTTIEVDDWRSKAIAEIKAGLIQFEPLAALFDRDLAVDLFRAAGVSVEVGSNE